MRAGQLRLRAGGPQHPTRQLTVTLGGTTRSRYVRLGELARVQALIATDEELWAIVNALTAVNLALLHSTPPSGRALGLPRVIREPGRGRARQSGYPELEQLEARVRLLAAGGTCREESAVLQADGGLGRRVDRQRPSADPLRHFLYAGHDEQRIREAPAARPAGSSRPRGRRGSE